MTPRHIRSMTSRKVLYAAIAGDLAVAATKLTAALWTGSSVMMSEAVHSVVDSGNSMLILYGMHRAIRRPDRAHPLGYGREIYFWSFVVAVQVFALGAGVTLYEGVTHVLAPQPIQDIGVNFAVIGLSALFDGTTWWIALKAFKGRKPWSAVPAAIHDSKDPPSFIVIFEDSASLIGLAIAFLGSLLTVAFHAPIIDAVASLLIGVLLATTATLLARETKGLLMGEAADPAIVAALLGLAKDMSGVANANGILTVHMGPRQIVVALSLEFADDLTTPGIEAKISELEQRLRLAHPDVIAVFVRPQSAEGYATMIAHRFGIAGADTERKQTPADVRPT